MIDEPTRRLDEGALRALVPRVLAGLVRRGEDFDAAEDALQEALLEALRVWPEHPPRDPRAWLATVATRRLVDARRSEAARHRREEATYAEPRPAATEEGDDTLFLLFCCCHPDLAPASQVALTLRAVGGLTTREIADAFYVPEATMAQRISRAKRALQGRRLDQPGDLAVVLRVLYLVYTAGHAGRVDLAGEAIRLARQLTLATEEPEARGLLALMLLNHARLPARLDSEGRIVTLDRQDRGLWDTREIAEGVRVLQSALAVQRPGRYQVEAAIAALHDDAASAEETDWPQILAWYDDLVALTDDPVRQDPAAVLGRAVAVGHVLGAAAGLRETDRLREVLGERHRWHAVRGHLHELGGDLPAAATAYADAARRATDVAERDHLVRQAARARAAELCRNSRPLAKIGSIRSNYPDARSFLAYSGLSNRTYCALGAPMDGVTIVGLDAVDVRFPTSRGLHGSDALNVDPDYSAAYVTLRTDRDDGLDGHGLTFTTGRGNEVVVAAIRSLAPLVVGDSLDRIRADMRGFWRRLTSDTQLRWLGPEKGVIHLATAAIVNAVWDLWAKTEGKPLWRLLTDLSPEELVGCVDFRYIDDVLTPEEALELVRDMRRGRDARIETTSRAVIPRIRLRLGGSAMTTRWLSHWSSSR